MPFSPTPIPHSGFGGGMGSARRSGAGLATWKIIQDMLEGPREREEKLPEVGAIDDTIVTEPGTKYLMTDVEKPWAGDKNPEMQGPLINRTQYDQMDPDAQSAAGTMPFEKYEDVEPGPTHAGMSYAGRALRPQDFDKAETLRRAQEELRLAQEKAASFGGQITPGWSQRRVNQKAAEVRQAQAALESVLPQRIKLDNEVFDIEPGGESRLLAASTQKYRPGEVGYRGHTGETFMPAGNKLPKDPTPSIRWTRDAETGESVAQEYTPGSESVKNIRTGIREYQPRDTSNDVSWGPAEIKRDKDGKAVVDENNNPVYIQRAFTPQGNDTGKTRRVDNVRGASGSRPMSMAEADIAKKAGKKTIEDHGSSNPQEIAKTTKLQYFQAPGTEDWYEVVMGPNGEKRAMRIPGKPSR